MRRALGVHAIALGSRLRKTCLACARWTSIARTCTTAIALCALIPASAALDIDTLMGLLAAHGGGQIEFTEERESGLLTEKLESRGTLVFRPPDYLEKQVLEPWPERFVVEGGRLTIEHGRKEARELRLDDFAPLRAMVEAFRATLAGDRATLERYFTLSLEHDAEDRDAGVWRLRLEPRDRTLAEHVSAVVLGGRGNVLLEVHTLEHNGDHTLMRLSGPDPTVR
ncbi:MAG: LolA family protein [Gammaproteobacteria bacterium]